ncbi:MAG: autotransporter outer membrane beta-barrel domain-containing protein, partial [Oxalobacter sp.]|nr:autotransporter outer membrane beta-barrel domain-containing protein [Oxalobacter sp.]
DLLNNETGATVNVDGKDAVLTALINGAKDSYLNISDNGTVNPADGSNLGIVQNGTAEGATSGGLLDIGSNNVAAQRITSLDTADKEAGGVNTGTSRLFIDGGTLSVAEDSSLGHVKVGKKGTVFNRDESTPKKDMATLTNQGNTVVNTSSGKPTQITIGKIINDGGNLQLNLNSKASNELTGANSKEVAQSGAEVIKLTSGEGDGFSLYIAEGDVNGAITATTDPTGYVTSVVEEKNTTADAVQKIAAMSYLQFRNQMNDLDKRMGDLRTMPKEDGLWARTYTGQTKYKDNRSQYKTLQIGADHRIGNFFVGGTASYADTDGSMKHGSHADGTNYSFGLYGGWLGDDGQFVDVILKRHHMETDYKINSAKGINNHGSYDTSGTSISVEYGWRLGIGDTGYYVEPQAEFMYGHLNSVNFKTSQDIKVKQDAIKAAIGRVGIATGWVDPKGRGSLYAKASYLHEWDGETDMKTSKSGQNHKYHEDLGGNWGELAFGGTVNLNKNVSAYGEVSTNFGNPVHTDYQFSAGIRFSFW